MTVLFYITSIIAIVATAMAITRLNAVHALLWLILSLLAVAVTFYTLGAPFVAALEAIVYAGAIMVLFLFVVMMLNVGPRESRNILMWAPGTWLGAGGIAALLLAEVVYVIVSQSSPLQSGGAIEPKQLSTTLFGPYLLGVELASMLLLAGLVGAYHIGRRESPDEGRSGER